MKKKKTLRTSLILLALFALWTVFVCTIDVKPIGPNSSQVGFSTLNKYFHELVGVNMTFYTVTDWLSIIPLGFVLIFALQGLLQWIKRKSITKVDRNLLTLGMFYVVVMAVFVLFEKIEINYRPILINGILEASYPSSTTMLVLCVMPTAIMHLNSYIKNKTTKKWVSVLITAFTIFMVVGRIISGVHWITDIIGGVLISTGLILMYWYTEQ